jgi:alpha-tubulin suppressor-like RCC1 family protein
MPKIARKGGDIKQRLQIPKGVPTKIEAFDHLNPKTLRIGMRHSAVISDDGKLFMFGSGNWGVLGQGNEQDYNFNNPVQVSFFEKQGLKVKDVSLGEYHTMALTDDGSVWTWGYAGKKGFFNWMYSQEIGALGHGDKEPRFTPTRVAFFNENKIKVKNISSGLYHCNVET